VSFPFRALNLEGRCCFDLDDAAVKMVRQGARLRIRRYLDILDTKLLAAGGLASRENENKKRKEERKWKIL
jgi:hypothetical protein